MKEWLFLLLLFASCRSTGLVTFEQQLKDHDARLVALAKMAESSLNVMPDSMKHWVPIFRKMLVNDQRYRLLNSNIGYTLRYAIEQNRLDSANIHIVDSFFNRYNRWPDKNWAGYLAHLTTSLILLHVDLKRQEHYYPLLKKAWQDGLVAGEGFAMLQDRINLYNKRPQVYGTQIKYYKNAKVLYPVADVDSLAERRKRVGLIPIEKYYADFNLTWDIGAYKKILPDLVKMYKVRGAPVE